MALLNLFNRKSTIILNSAQQKDDYIEKLDQANIPYKISEKKDSFSGDKIVYVIKLNAKDLKNVK